MIEELDMKACIEEHLPTKSDQKILTHADAIAAMILNGLGFANRRIRMEPVLIVCLLGWNGPGHMLINLIPLKIPCLHIQRQAI